MFAGPQQILAESTVPFKRVIDGSALTAALVDPTPAATKALVSDSAAHAVLDVDGFPVARIMVGGTDAANETINYQVIGWSQGTGSGNTEVWIPRVLANGVATLGADVYSATGTGLGAAANFFADQITDTIGMAITASAPNDLRAVLEVPMLNSQRIEIQTDLGTAATADVFMQFGEPSEGLSERTPVKIVQAVAVPGTAEALVAVQTFATAVYLQAKRVDGNNTGRVYLGLSDVDKTTAQLFDLGPNDPAELVMPPGTKIDLNKLYVDSVTATDGVLGYYIPAP